MVLVEAVSVAKQECIMATGMLTRKNTVIVEVFLIIVLVDRIDEQDIMLIVLSMTVFTIALYLCSRLYGSR